MGTSRKHLLKTAILVVCGVIATNGVASADIIAQYTFTSNNTTNNPIAPTTTAANVTVGSLTAGNLHDFTSNYAIGGGGAHNFGRVLRVTPGTTISAAAPMNPPYPSGAAAQAIVDTAFTDNDVFSFTVTPSSGKVLDLSSLTFLEAAGGNDFPRYFGIRSSLTGSTDLDFDLSSQTLPVPTLVTLDLSSIAAFQNVTGPVTFYFAVASNNTNRSVDFNDITLNGSVAVPEPTSLGIWLLASLFGSSYGWRKWKSRRAV